MVPWGLVSEFYQSSGPAFQFLNLAALAYGYKAIWKAQVQPWLSDLQNQQDHHGEKLAERAINAGERDVLLEDAHQRLDQAEDARVSLRDRLTRLEQRYASDHEFNPDDIGPTAGTVGGDD